MSEHEAQKMVDTMKGLHDNLQSKISELATANTALALDNARLVEALKDCRQAIDPIINSRGNIAEC